MLYTIILFLCHSAVAQNHEAGKLQLSTVSSWERPVSVHAENSLVGVPAPGPDLPPSAQIFEISSGASLKRSHHARDQLASSDARPVIRRVWRDPRNDRVPKPVGMHESLLQGSMIPAGNTTNTTSEESNEESPHAITHSLLVLVIATGAFSLVALAATIFWLTRVPHDEPLQDGLEEPAEGTITSLGQIWGITSVNFAYGVAVCYMGVFIMPKESRFMFPEHPSIALGAFEALVACSMLLGPVAGRVSDSLKHSMGRRRPMIHLCTCFAAVLTTGMWVASLYNLRSAYLVLLLFQQMSWNAVNASQTALLADLVHPSRKDFASAVQIASLLAGAIVSIVMFQGFALDAMDFRMNYLPLVLVSWLSLPMLHLAAPEQSSVRMSLKAGLDWGQPREALASVFDMGTNLSPDFGLVTRERGVYYAACASKAFVLFFLKDGLGITSDKDQSLFLGEVALDSACAATIAGLITSLVFSMTKVRVQVVACFGAMLMACSSQFWTTVFISNTDTRKMLMLCYIAVYGAGQGCYLAADLALAIRTMPDPNEASRYMGLWGFSAFVGGGLGAIGASFVMEIFGRVVPEHMGKVLATGSYHLYGYMALFIGTFLCDAYVGFICLNVRTRAEYNNPKEQPKGAQDMERNLQDGS